MIKVEGIQKTIQTLSLIRRPAKKRSFFRKQYHKDFVAPGNISFEIGAGQTPGIIGMNGAGKSTLLKLLSVIIIPDSGTIRIAVKVTGRFELRTGLNERDDRFGIYLGMSQIITDYDPFTSPRW